MTSEKQERSSQPTDSKRAATNGPSEAEIRQESSKAAQKALEAQQKANELKEAANGAADPDERQKLMEEAIDYQVEAESLGKTAKYMRRGTFQGMAVGCGLGTVPGLTLGTLTGTLVGGLTSAVLGGLGAGLGSLVGFAHGPFWNIGEVMGKGIRKITGDLPGWAATDAQKRKLEEMMQQISQEDMPASRELKGMANDGTDAAKHQGKYYAKSAASYMPGSRAFATGKAGDGAWQTRSNARQEDEPERVDNRTVDAIRKSSNSAQGNSSAQRGSDQKSDTVASGQKHAAERSQSRPRKQPRKLERRSDRPAQQSPTENATQRKPPRKLEVRSGQAG